MISYTKDPDDFVMKKDTSGRRIAIGGRMLDEVQIRYATQRSPGTISSIAYPKSRHSAHKIASGIEITAQAATVAKLFADGDLPAIRAGNVEVAIDGESIGMHVLIALEIGKEAVDTPIVLRFESVRVYTESQP